MTSISRQKSGLIFYRVQININILNCHRQKVFCILQCNNHKLIHYLHRNPKFMMKESNKHLSLILQIWSQQCVFLCFAETKFCIAKIVNEISLALHSWKNRLHFAITLCLIWTLFFMVRSASGHNIFETSKAWFLVFNFGSNAIHGFFSWD